MQRENQSIMDLFQTFPLSSFVFNRSPISNKEAETLYDLWKNGPTDEYGKIVVGSEVDGTQIANLTTQGFIRNTRHNNTASQRLLEITNKGKEVIKKIILHQEKSAFDKKSAKIDYESICRLAEMEEKHEGKVASTQYKCPDNWLGNMVQREIN